ncbi:MAG: hypothetical protein HY001_00560 [Candidatus Portnoybacteria bacterium]|nr:hypothetical protein [Candidatus Portnoybacteria bacterium]
MNSDTKRIFKRIVIALIYFLVIGGIGLLWYALRQPPVASCFDNIQNQGEEGVDCGGSCKSCEEIKKLSLFEVKFFPTKKGFVDVFAELSNTNISYGVSQLAYTFELYDRDNTLVGAKSGVTYFQPNSTKFVIEQAIPVIKEAKTAKFQFAQPQFEEVKNYVKPRLNVLGVRSKPLGEGEAGFLAVQGNVINQTNFNFDKVELAIRLKNDAGETVAVNRHEVKTLTSNENRFFEARWPYRVPFFSKIEVEVDTNIFEESNYLKFLK